MHWLPMALSGMEMFVLVLHASRIPGHCAKFSLSFFWPLKNFYSHCVISMPLISVFSNTFCFPAIFVFYYFLPSVGFFFPFDSLLSFLCNPSTQLCFPCYGRQSMHILGSGIQHRLCPRNSMTLRNLTFNLLFPQI